MANITTTPIAKSTPVTGHPTAGSKVTVSPITETVKAAASGIAPMPAGVKVSTSAAPPPPPLPVAMAPRPEQTNKPKNVVQQIIAASNPVKVVQAPTMLTLQSQQAQSKNAHHVQAQPLPIAKVPPQSKPMQKISTSQNMVHHQAPNSAVVVKSAAPSVGSRILDENALVTPVASSPIARATSAIVSTKENNSSRMAEPIQSRTVVLPRATAAPFQSSQPAAPAMQASHVAPPPSRSPNPEPSSKALSQTIGVPPQPVKSMVQAPPTPPAPRTFMTLPQSGGGSVEPAPFPRIVETVLTPVEEEPEAPPNMPAIRRVAKAIELRLEEYRRQQQG